MTESKYLDELLQQAETFLDSDVDSLVQRIKGLDEKQPDVLNKIIPLKQEIKHYYNFLERLEPEGLLHFLRKNRKANKQVKKICSVDNRLNRIINQQLKVLEKEYQRLRKYSESGTPLDYLNGLKRQAQDVNYILETYHKLQALNVISPTLKAILERKTRFVDINRSRYLEESQDVEYDQNTAASRLKKLGIKADIKKNYASEELESLSRERLTQLLKQIEQQEASLYEQSRNASGIVQILNVVGDKSELDLLKNRVQDILNSKPNKIVNIPSRIDKNKFYENKTRHFFNKRGKREVILKVNPNVYQHMLPEDKKAFFNEINASLSKQFHGCGRTLNNFNYLLMEVEAKEAENVIRALAEKNSLGKYKDVIMQPYQAQLVFIPPLIKSNKAADINKNDMLWNLSQMGVGIAQQYTLGEGISLGMIDTGTDYNHGELENNFGAVKGYNFVDNNDDPMDDRGHGTHTSGTCCGNSVGVAPCSQVFALKVLDCYGTGSSADVIRAVDWAIDNNLKVLNLSLGSFRYSEVEQDIFLQAYKSGITICAAAGNYGEGADDDPYNYPASYDGVLSVAAIDQNNLHAPFSQKNDRVDISGYGVNIYSSIPGNGYDTYSGTSMASPHVAGTALLAAAYAQNQFGIDLSPENFEILLKDTAEYLGDDSHMFGAGLARPDLLIEYLNENYAKQRAIGGG